MTVAHRAAGDADGQGQLGEKRHRRVSGVVDQRLVNRCDVDGIVAAIELYGCYDCDELFDVLESSFGTVQTQLGNAAPPAFLALLKARLRANRSSESAGAARPPTGTASPAASAYQTPHGHRADGGVHLITKPYSSAGAAPTANRSAAFCIRLCMLICGTEPLPNRMRKP